MQYHHKDLNEWLEANTFDTPRGKRVILPALQMSCMAVEARLLNLIKFERLEDDEDSYSENAVYYLTPQGEIALGITAHPGDIAPADSAPLAVGSDGTEAGNVECMKVVFKTLLTTIGKLPIDEKKINHCLHMLADQIPDELEVDGFTPITFTVTDSNGKATVTKATPQPAAPQTGDAQMELAQETIAALRAQLAAAQAELTQARERIAALERQLDGERKLLVKAKAALRKPNEILPTRRIANALEIIENE